ncbi:hypothetical protein HDV05_004162 [Chytridiales sp. JEL 0842]|nr:hypothetical protein HDV05_004162 [Chytridiales sp. JEL 0842]
MNGFVENNGGNQWAIASLDTTLVEHTYNLAKHYVLFDKWHASVPGPTNPNRAFLTAGTSGGRGYNGTLKERSIFQVLSEKGITWKNYQDSAFPPDAMFYEWTRKNALGNVVPFKQFFSDAKTGNLPSFSYINPECCSFFSYHPPSPVTTGENFVKGIYEAVRTSPSWNETAFIITFDEHGGFADHVSPPRAPPPGDNKTFKWTSGDQTGGFRFDRFGVRVPTYIISPFVQAGKVEHGFEDAEKQQINLDDNMIFQWLSMVYLCFIVFLFVIMSFGAGLDAANMPTVGQKLLQTPTSVIGQVLFNFTLTNTIPSWVNTKHPKVSIHKCVWTAIGVSCGMYCFTGLFAAMAFDVPEGSDLFAAMTLRFKGTSWANLLNFITFTWPIMVLLTSIHVSIIIVKLNLITSRICSKDWANFYGTILPFIVAVPFQTGDFLIVFSNWTSIIFQSICNFVAPFLIYIFLEKRNLVLQQSVLDELENLDLDGGIKKRTYAYDDDFDYVYHLPHADLTRIGPRKYDPFAKFAKVEDEKKPNFGEAKATSPTSTNNNNIPSVPVPVISTDSSSALRARRGIGRILDLGQKIG